MGSLPLGYAQGARTKVAGNFSAVCIPASAAKDSAPRSAGVVGASDRMRYVLSCLFLSAYSGSKPPGQLLQ